jgi:acid phosphatase (class A)
MRVLSFASLRSPIARFAVLSLMLPLSVLAESSERLGSRVYLSESNSAFEKVVSPFPADGSKALEDDWAMLFQLQKSRTSMECSVANGESSPTSSPYLKDDTFRFLTAAQKKNLESFYSSLMMDTISVASLYKDAYDRLRPFKQNNLIKPCIAKPLGKSYPSGHATIGMVVAFALSDVFPERKDALLKRGLLYGHNRVLGGVHFPSDVAMGQRLAEAIILEMRKSPRYQKDVLNLQNLMRP